MRVSTMLPTNPDPALNFPVTPEDVEELGLLPEEYKKIQEILGRDPNITELGVFSVMWSEHCSYKNSKCLLRSFPTEKSDCHAPYQVLVKAGEENAGVIDIGDGWAICFKIESHNHPSAVEPFEGAATGVGGIIRDIFTMGARPVLLTNSLRFGEIDSSHVKGLIRGVVQGIAHYGNCIGIPNVGGDIYFDSCYEGNPLVNALCLGIVKHKEIKRGAAVGMGNPVYYVGPATGRDGLGGASFASKELSEESAADRPSVQKGDPFMEKLLLEACLEMMAVPGLVVGIQDMGAAGLTCSSCETASRGNSGLEIDLDCVPQRETGMNSYEILLSESQERMLVIVQRGREAELEAIFKKWDLPAVVIGKVTEGEDLEFKQNNGLIARIPAKALADDAPIYNREFKKPNYLFEKQNWDETKLPDLDDDAAKKTLPLLLSTPTIAHKDWVWRQYDHMVMTNTIVGPGSDAAIVRLRLGEDLEKIIAISNDCNNRYCYLNPYRGGQIALAESIRNLACSGARPLAMTNCLNFGNPYKPEVFYMLKECVRGLVDACKFFDLPVLGGNVSLYNENQEGAIDPTPVVSVVGIVDTEEMITTQKLKNGDEAIILIGGLCDEIGGSYYLKEIHDFKTGDAPTPNLAVEEQINSFVLRLIKNKQVVAAHDISEGGLLVALTEMLFAQEQTFGANLDIMWETGAIRFDAQLFGESQGRILVAVNFDDIDSILKLAQEVKVPAMLLGLATKDPSLIIKSSAGDNRIVWNTNGLRQAWGCALTESMNDL